MPEDLRVCVLGPVRAWIGGHEIDLGAARQRAVFAVLAAHAGRLVGRDELITAIWGDSPPATAAGSVYTYVSGLRRALTPGLLTSASSSRSAAARSCPAAISSADCARSCWNWSASRPAGSTRSR